jgi:hypothetical protein
MGRNHVTFKFNEAKATQRRPYSEKNNGKMNYVN